MNWRIRFRYIVWPRLTKPFRVVSRSIGKYITINRVAFLIALSAVGLWYWSETTFDELIPNIIPELLSIAITVFIIDALYQKRSDTERKNVLITQLQSKNNAVASEALKELDAKGWLSDGTLQKAFLISTNLDGNSFSGADLRDAHLSFSSLKDTSWFEADLEGAFLYSADLQNATLSMHATGPHHAEANLKNANFSQANLHGARTRDEQLVQLSTLWRATMPDGKIYNGRFNFPDDVENILKFVHNPDDPNEWAQFYEVTPEEYVSGQVWAQANQELFKLRDDKINDNDNTD